MKCCEYGARPLAKVVGLRRAGDGPGALPVAFQCPVCKAIELDVASIEERGIRIGVEAAVEHWRIDSALGDEIDAVCRTAREQKP